MEKRHTYNPACPPVTMATFPDRLGMNESSVVFMIDKKKRDDVLAYV
jgi:hypothetical protein